MFQKGLHLPNRCAEYADVVETSIWYKSVQILIICLQFIRIYLFSQISYQHKDLIKMHKDTNIGNIDKS